MKEKMELPRIIYQMFYFSQSPVIEWLLHFFIYDSLGSTKWQKKNTCFLFWLWLGLQNLDILKVSCQVNSLASKMAGFYLWKDFSPRKSCSDVIFHFKDYTVDHEQHGFELHRPTYTCIFFFSINILGTFCWDLWLKKLTDEHIEMSRKVKEMTHA